MCCVQWCDPGRGQHGPARPRPAARIPPLNTSDDMPSQPAPAGQGLQPYMPIEAVLSTWRGQSQQMSSFTCCRPLDRLWRATMKSQSATTAHLPIHHQSPIACVFPQQLRQGCNSRVPDDNEFICIHKCHPLVTCPAADWRSRQHVLKRHYMPRQACYDNDYPCRMLILSEYSWEIKRSTIAVLQHCSDAGLSAPTYYLREKPPISSLQPVGFFSDRSSLQQRKMSPHL